MKGIGRNGESLYKYWAEMKTTLQNTIEAVVANQTGENVFDLIVASRRVLSSSGLTWDQIIDIVEKVTGDDLTGRRPKKCQKCGGGINIHGKCVVYGCENYYGKEEMEEKNKKIKQWDEEKFERLKRKLEK